MEKLPKDVEHIILRYKIEMEHYEQQQVYMGQICAIIRRFKFQFKLIADLIAPLMNTPDMAYLQALTLRVDNDDMHDLLDAVQIILSV